jgi:cytochrome c-type biogenesis protein CcmE
MQFYFSVGEVQQRSTELVGKALRVSGIVVPDSVQFDPVGLHLEFCLVDQVGGDQSPLRVHMVGQAPPDQMGGEAKAIAEGHLEQDGSFRAEALMMTCASKYQADLSQ